jgi:hypothetical protein
MEFVISYIYLGVVLAYLIFAVLFDASSRRQINSGHRGLLVLRNGLIVIFLSFFREVVSVR